MFEQALGSEGTYPPTWGKKKLQYRDYPFLPTDLRRQLALRKQETETPPFERIYCTYIDPDQMVDVGQRGDACGAFVGSIDKWWKHNVQLGVSPSTSCKACKSLYCMNCGESFVRPHRCRNPGPIEHDNGAFDDLVKGKDYQVCPSVNCGRKIELRDGCNDMKCSCGTRFCFVCGKSDVERGHWRKRGADGACPRFGHTSQPRAIYDEPQDIGLFLRREEEFLLQAHDMLRNPDPAASMREEIQRERAAVVMDRTLDHVEAHIDDQEMNQRLAWVDEQINSPRVDLHPFSIARLRTRLTMLRTRQTRRQQLRPDLIAHNDNTSGPPRGETDPELETNRDAIRDMSTPSRALSTDRHRLIDFIGQRQQRAGQSLRPLGRVGSVNGSDHIDAPGPEPASSAQQSLRPSMIARGLTQMRDLQGPHLMSDATQTLERVQSVVPPLVNSSLGTNARGTVDVQQLLLARQEQRRALLASNR